MSIPLDGNVQAAIAAVDWAATPLGLPQTWPQSLRTTVRTMLGSRFAMWMAWGPDLTFLCNDAYRRDTLGSKYPWALGKPASEVWAEIWPEIGPRIDRVIRTGEATWDEALQLYLRRSGFLEETYHTFSYSPLAADDGSIAGMLCVVSEDTERVISVRRMATLRDLGAATAAAVLTPDEVLRAACEILSRNRSDIPFAALYIRAGATESDHVVGARLVGTVGLTEGHPGAPLRLRSDDPEAVWPLISGEPSVVDIPKDLADLPHGAQPLPPHRAQVVPLAATPGARPDGWLVVGLNPCRPLNLAHTGFLDLIARHISAGFAAGTAFQFQRARAEELAELDRAKTAFFTNVSHELRTPLTLMLGPTADALADREVPLPDAHRRRIEIAHHNAERLLGLVNSLLDLARAESGRLSPRLQLIDLGRHTAELASLFDSVAADAGLKLDVRLPTGLAPVPMDQDMWAKIVLNLVSNAVKHTFSGGVTVDLRTSGESPDRTVELRVADTGIGIDPADQKRLFERFHRVEGARSRSHEGSGIGLALVAELAGLLGGTVGVESEPGVGSTFTVRLPVGEDAPSVSDHADVRPSVDSRGLLAAAATWGEGTPAEGPAPPGGLPCVLVVDDNPDMRSYLTSLLSGQFRTELAIDGVDALEHIRRERPDLVLTDVMMPRLDGFGLVAALRADPALVDLPVVMLSARAGEDGVAEGLEAGADDYLVKPFTARELLARVRANLELERSRRIRTELERSRELLDQAQRLARVGSWEIDLETNSIACSPQFARMLEMTQEQVEALDLPAALETLLHPKDRQRVADVLGAGVDGAPISYEAVFRTATDGEILMEIVGEVENDPEGNPVLLRGSIQDIAERRRTEQRAALEVTARHVAAREHQIAEQLQASLLPALNFDPDHLEVATYYKAGVEGTQVGGDWYDVIELGAGRTALVIGDVMGRGVSAAAVMGQLRSAIRAYARLDLAPADVLELCDGAVRDLGEDQIVTCVYAVFDPVENSLSYANAGHLPPLLVTSDGPARRMAGAASAPLGSGPLTVSGQTIELPPGSTLVLYTDGLVERRDRDIDAGIDLLAQELSVAMPDLAVDPAALVARMLPEGPDDDVALLVARVPTGEQQIATAQLDVGDDLREVAASRDFVTRVLSEWGVSANTAADAVLLAGELVTNALTHGQGAVQVRLRHTRDALMLEVSDQASFLPRRLRSGLEDEHGRGLLLVTRLSERWGVRPTPTGKSVWCVLALGRGG